MSGLQKAFDKLGYPLLLNEGRLGRHEPYRINTGKDEEGRDAFRVDLLDGIELVPLDTNPREEGMLILFRDTTAIDDNRRNLAKMLIGHDERQLFVAAVPLDTKSVIDAKEKLKPGIVRDAEQKKGVKKSKKNKHRNEARIRQGDFFFVPAPNFVADPRLIMKNQPLRRGRGNAHMLEEAIEVGGRSGWEHDGHFITDFQYRRLKPEEKTLYRSTRQNPTVYVRGKVRHPEHKTIVLNGWHRVVPNTEAGARDIFGRPVLGSLAYTD